ncbi:restriction endonuclease subunit S [Marinobacterium jannaschii]|uniref:restriction endonuclease subunit S n=1 Tax=Marinobacterium jannaschii TaxID=64970 RepID=UPI00047F4391|nr:restriction endonuclease subunit S [Marinobacterium jannaschii]
MSEVVLPEGWESSTISTVCLLNPKERLADELDVGFMPMAGVPTVFHGTCQFELRKWESVKKGFTQFRDGDAIFAKITPCFENSKAAVIEGFPSGWGAGSTEYYVLRPIGHAINPKLLLALVKTKAFLVNGATNMSGSVGHKRVPKTFVESYPLPLPPIAEQKEIADRLDNLLAQVDSIKARLDAIPVILKRFRQSVLAAATSGELTKTWRERSALGKHDVPQLKEIMEREWFEAKEREFKRKGKRPKSDNWKKFGDPVIIENDELGWVSVSLENVAEVIDPNPSHRMPKYVDDGLPFISSENITRNDSVDFNKGKKITDEELQKQKQRYEVTHTTFAFTRIGTIGKSVSLPLPHNYGVSHAMAIVTPSGVIDGAFLRLVISCESIIKQAFDGVQSVGVPDLGIGKMKAFRIPLPMLDEQEEIVRRVSGHLAIAKQIEQQVKKAQSQVNNLTQSILAKAFRGELTVDWRAEHPELISGENSAQALLERIKAEQEKLAPQKKGRKKRT